MSAGADVEGQVFLSTGVLRHRFPGSEDGATPIVWATGITHSWPGSQVSSPSTDTGTCAWPVSYFPAEPHHCRGTGALWAEASGPARVSLDSRGLTLAGKGRKAPAPTCSWVQAGGSKQGSDSGHGTMWACSTTTVHQGHGQGAAEAGVAQLCAAIGSHVPPRPPSHHV